VASLGKKEDFIDHRLGPDLNRFDPAGLEGRESLFVQRIGPGGDTNGLDHPGSEQWLDLFEIKGLIISVQCRETSTVKCDLSLPAVIFRRRTGERGFNQFPDRGRRRNLCSGGLLVAEETALGTTQIGEEDRNNQWSHNKAILTNV
jgi:hypothetical protein